MDGIQKTAVVLAGAGAINWGLIQFAGMNLVDKIPFLNQYPTIVYGAIAISGIYVVYNAFK